MVCARRKKVSFVIMENVIASINISSMSKKVSPEFKGDTPTMTAYFTAESPADRETLLNFGLREYTPKDGGDNFFISKVTAKVMLYHGSEDLQEKPVEMDGTIDGTGFKFPESEFHQVNFIKGEKAGQTFTRIQAIMMGDSKVAKIEAQNPFAVDTNK